MCVKDLLKGSSIRELLAVAKTNSRRHTINREDIQAQGFTKMVKDKMAREKQEKLEAAGAGDGTGGTAGGDGATGGGDGATGGADDPNASGDELTPDDIHLLEWDCVRSLNRNCGPDAQAAGTAGAVAAVSARMRDTGGHQ